MSGIPGIEVEVGGSYAATRRLPLDCRAITPRAVYPFPLKCVALEVACEHAPSAQPSTYPTSTRPNLSTLAPMKSRRFRQMFAPPLFQTQPRCIGSFGVASVVLQCAPPSKVLATQRCQTPLN